MSTKINDSGLFLYIYLMKNTDQISCQLCYDIFEINKIYRLRNTKMSYCDKCIKKWLISKYINPSTGLILEKTDIEINYEMNELIEIYTKYKKLNIKNININISIEKNDNLLAH